MARHLSWYLVELERRLDPGMSVEDRHAILAQAEDHLWTIKQELMSAGIDEAMAEEVAIQRFGSVSGMTGETPAAEPRRSSWLAPILIILGAVAVLAAALMLGSYRSIEIAAGLGGASLFLSALGCARAGKFPSLAFGLLLVASFTGLSMLAGTQFLGPDAGFLRRSDVAKLAPMVRAAQVRLQREATLYRLGERYIESGSSEEVPPGLRLPDGIITPPDWNSYWIQPVLPIGFSPYSDVNRILTPTVFGRTQSPALAYQTWKGRSSLWNRAESAHVLSNQAERILASIENPSKYESDNVFGGIAIGSGITLLWLILASAANAVANLRWDFGSRSRRRRREPAPHFN